MKYFLWHETKWNYDEIEDEEITFYIAPDNFKFDENLVIEFLTEKGIPFKRNKGYRSHIVDVGNTQIYLDWIMSKGAYSSYPKIEKGEFRKWLQTKNVYEVPYEVI